MSKWHLDHQISIQIKEDKHIMHKHIYLLALDEELEPKIQEEIREKSSYSSNLEKMTLNPKSNLQMHANGGNESP